MPLAGLPGGTGNLLAVNFDIPTDLDGAVEVALYGERRRLDVASMDGDQAGVTGVRGPAGRRSRRGARAGYR